MVYHSAPAPVLPAEVVIEVLKLQLSAVPWSEIPSLRARISLVCKHWAGFIASTPAFWNRISYIHWEIVPPLAEIQRLLPYLHTSISRSGALPLYLEGPLPRGLFDFGKFVRLVEGVAGRWKGLRLVDTSVHGRMWRLLVGSTVTVTSTADGDSETTPSTGVTEWCELECLHVTMAPKLLDEPEAGESEDSFSGPSVQARMPKLRELVFRVQPAARTASAAPHIAKIPCRKLWRLSIEGLPAVDQRWGTYLSQCRRLRHLQVTRGSWDSHLPLPAAVAPIRLPLLSLHIICRHEMIHPGDPFPGFSLPNLKKLHIQGGTLPDGSVALGPTGITVLELQDVSGVSQDLRRLCHRALPQLTRLRVRGLDVGPEFLLELNEARAIPLLQSVSILRAPPHQIAPPPQIHPPPPAAGNGTAADRLNQLREARAAARDSQVMSRAPCSFLQRERDAFSAFISARGFSGSGSYETQGWSVRLASATMKVLTS